MLLLSLMAPLAATVIQLAISRTASTTRTRTAPSSRGTRWRSPSALRKLELGTRQLPLPPERELVNSSHMMIANPFRGQGVAKLFSTHPPMAERIARLEALAGYRR